MRGEKDGGINKHLPAFNLLPVCLRITWTLLGGVWEECSLTNDTFILCMSWLTGITSCSGKGSKECKEGKDSSAGSLLNARRNGELFFAGMRREAGM